MNVIEKVKERPILFSSEMVKAILDGGKTQTRRVFVPTMTKPKVVPLNVYKSIPEWYGAQETDEDGRPIWIGEHPDYPYGSKWFTCNYGKVGDKLWVRETWRECPNPFSPTGKMYCYRATSIKAEGVTWKPSIHMPRAASRILLEVTGVRVERVQDISESDAKAEGVSLDSLTSSCYHPDYTCEQLLCYGKPHRKAFMTLWDTINAKRGYGWEANPFVWVVEFKRIETAADGSSQPVSQKEGV